jgi:hypothetical protein
MAAATARMITRGLSASERRDWSLAWLEMEARLNAHFPRPVVEAWLDYGHLVSYFDPAALSSARTMSGYAVGETFQDFELGDYRVRRALIYVANMAQGIDRRRAQEMNPWFTEYTSAQARGLPTGWKKAPKRERLQIYEDGLLIVEEEIADQVLRSHPIGYSTTAGDLFRDLIP